MPYDLDGGRPQHVVLVVGESLTRSNDDRLARVNAERIDVLHVTYLQVDEGAGVEINTSPLVRD